MPSRVSARIFEIATFFRSHFLSQRALLNGSSSWQFSTSAVLCFMLVWFWLHVVLHSFFLPRLARIPERLAPGYFDIWVRTIYREPIDFHQLLLSHLQFQSHQIFHVFVVAAACVHYYGISVLANHQANTDACRPANLTAPTVDNAFATVLNWWIISIPVNKTVCCLFRWLFICLERTAFCDQRFVGLLLSVLFFYCSLWFFPVLFSVTSPLFFQMHQSASFLLHCDIQIKRENSQTSSRQTQIPNCLLGGLFRGIFPSRSGRLSILPCEPIRSSEKKENRGLGKTCSNIISQKRKKIESLSRGL